MLLIKALVSLTVLVICDSARILAVFPLPSFSHYFAYRPFFEELAKRGHEVTVITADPAYPKGQAPANYTEIDVHPQAYSFKERIQTFTKGNGIFAQIDPIFELLYRVFDVELTESTEVQNLLRDETKQFDLLMLAACVQATLALQHVYKAPVIQISSFGPMEINNFVFGSATHPLFYPTVYHQRIFNLTLWEKVVEVSKYYYVVFLEYYYERLQTEAMRKHFPDMPSVYELSNNVDMLFLNVHPMWEMNRPVPPNVIYLGGLQLKPPKELPQDLKSYLDSSKEGVIYMSFGTNLASHQIPAETIAIFMRVFSELPYNVLWKWEEQEIPDKPSNVRIEKWFPQADVLRHPNIKLFIMQGGLQSTDEAIAAGVPLIALPIFGDQWNNAEKFRHFKIGMGLDMGKINEVIFKNAITDMIADESYRVNMAELRSVMRDQPASSLERAVWWTEYVARRGGAKHLRSAAANVPWTQYLMLDVLMVLAAVLTVVAVALRRLVRAVGRLVGRKEKTN